MIGRYSGWLSVACNQVPLPQTNEKRNPRPYINPRDSLVSGGCETELILLTKILLVNLPQNGMATGEGEVTQRLCIFLVVVGVVDWSRLYASRTNDSEGRIWGFNVLTFNKTGSSLAFNIFTPRNTFHTYCHGKIEERKGKYLLG